MTNPAYEATNSDVEKLIADMKVKAEQATPGKWVYSPENTSIEYDVGSDDHQGSITYMDSGDFTQRVTDLNGAHVAAACPENVLKLIAALERERRRNGQLKAERDALRESGLNGQANTRAAADIYFQLIEECDIPPGGSLVQHIDAMREVAPLCVKLPEAYTIRPGHPINEGERGVMIPKEGGNWFSRFDVEHAIRVAGGTVEGSE